jgi:hypothetical protein
MDPFKFRFQIFLVVFLIVFVFGTLGFMVIERRSLIDALYFSIVTIATVGYGDVHPVTLPGKILTVLIIVTGVGTFLGVIANATEMMLNKREKQVRFEKLNMVIGTFFSEVGRQLLADFSRFDPQVEGIRKTLIITKDWLEHDFTRSRKILKTYNYAISIQNYDLEILRSFLFQKRDFLLRLLENPILLEHESFTQLLQTVFHVTEELSYRDNLSQIPDTDRAHLAGDIKRSYAMLVQQWLQYMQYLKDNYPYLFSLAIRTNPFDAKASPIVE